MEKKDGGLNGWFVLAVGVFIFLLADNSKPLLPDHWYCGLGAGKIVVYPNRPRAAEWNNGNGCDGYDPSCAARSQHVPSREVCIHGSLWQALISKIG